jgi:hypothetical protein
MFETPNTVFTDELLRPEEQDPEAFAAGVDAIVDSMKSVALHYFADGSIHAACPPLKALLHIMVEGHFKGMEITDPRLRAMFSRESLLASEWYQERLRVKQQRDIALWKRHLASLEAFRSTGGRAHPWQRVPLDNLMATAQRQFARVTDTAYLAELEGTLGADPFHGQ